MSVPEAPRVFLSHASEDKDRFVLAFAKKLRANGIDAWVDRWEMLPGDSLVDKIFEEGIKRAQAVIVVLSTFSVNKPWVREELNASIVQRINGSSKIIPIVLDDCEVPVSLQSTYWVRIADLTSYDSEFNQIVNAIFGHTDKPPTGAPPRRIQTIIETIPHLTKLDSLLFKLSCELLDQNGDDYIFKDGIHSIIRESGYDEEECYESLELLHGRGYIEGHKVIDGTDHVHDFKVTTWGYDQYARTYLKDFAVTVKAVTAQIVNHKITDTAKIAEAIGKPLKQVNHIVTVFENNGWLRISNRIGTVGLELFLISPELKRRLM